MKLFGLIIACGLSLAQAHAEYALVKLSKDVKLVKGTLSRADGKLSNQDTIEYSDEWKSYDASALQEQGAMLKIGGIELVHATGKSERFTLQVKLWTTPDQLVAINGGLVYTSTPTISGYLMDLPVLEVQSRSYAMIKELYTKYVNRKNFECVVDSGVIDTVLTGETSTNYLRIRAAKCQ